MANERQASKDIGALDPIEFQNALTALETVKPDDWFQDDNGIIWEFRYDITANLHQWFEIDPDICGSLDPTRERPYFKNLELYATNGIDKYRKFPPSPKYMWLGAD